MKRVMCVWFPHWPIQRLVGEKPELKERAVVVYRLQRGLRVFDASESARAWGVAPAMTLAEAQSLAVRKRPRKKEAAKGPSDVLHTFVHDAQADRDALKQWALWCERFSPLAGIEDAEFPSSLLLDLTGTGRLFGDERRLARRVKTALGQQGLFCRVGLADTIGAAWALAHFGDEAEDSDVGPADGMLPSLPVEALRLQEPTVSLLHQLGLRTVGQVNAVPRASLASRLGSELVLRLKQLSGEAEEVVVPQRAAGVEDVQWSPEAPTERVDVLHSALEHLLDPLTAQLPSHHGVRGLQVKLDLLEGSAVEFAVDLHLPSSCPAYLLELLKLRMESVRLSGPVTQVRLRATCVCRAELCQQEMFTGQSRRHPRQLAGLLDRLRSRLGRGAVLRARWTPDPQPEYACQFDPGLEDLRRRPISWPEVGAGRPVRLKPKPEAVNVVSVIPEGPPLRLCWQGQQHRIARSWGPERIQTGWWRGRPVRRDYYRIETSDGRRFWIFRQSGRRWGFQGCFD